MATIIKLSITEKLKIRRSVDRTVAKLRFSRVRKYFWLRWMVLICDDRRMMDSSMEECWAGSAPCLEGSWARASFSTCIWSVNQHAVPVLVSYGDYVLRSDSFLYSVGLGSQRTAISKSTNFSANVLISLLKQNRYSPASCAVKTKSPCRSLDPSMITRSLGPMTV